DAEHIVSGKIGEHGGSGQGPRTRGQKRRKGCSDRIPFVSFAYRTNEQALGLQSHLEFFIFENVRGACRRSGVLVLLPALFCRALGAYRYILASVAFPLEGDLAGGGGEQRMVRTDADITPRVKLGSSLTYKNDAANDAFAAEFLHAQTSAVRVAAIARRSACFLVGHGPSSRTLLRRPSRRGGTHLLIAQPGRRGNPSLNSARRHGRPQPRRRSEFRSPGRS